MAGQRDGLTEVAGRRRDDVRIRHAPRDVVGRAKFEAASGLKGFDGEDQVGAQVSGKPGRFDEYRRAGYDRGLLPSQPLRQREPTLNDVGMWRQTELPREPADQLIAAEPGFVRELREGDLCSRGRIDTVARAPDATCRCLVPGRSQRRVPAQARDEGQ